MDYTIIEVPDMNDSVSSIVIDGKQYRLRFTWNDTGGYWMLGIYASLGEPIVIGQKIVPNFPLNLFWSGEDIPKGTFAAVDETEKLDSIGRNDFIDGKAQFVYIPAE